MSSSCKWWAIINATNRWPRQCSCNTPHTDTRGGLYTYCLLRRGGCRELTRLQRQDSDPLTNILQDYIQRSDDTQNRMADAVMVASTVKGSFGVFIGNMCQDLNDDHFIEFSRKTLVLFYNMRESQASQRVAPPPVSSYTEAQPPPPAPTPAPQHPPRSHLPPIPRWPSPTPPPKSQLTP